MTCVGSTLSSSRASDWRRWYLWRLTERFELGPLPFLWIIIIIIIIIIVPNYLLLRSIYHHIAAYWHTAPLPNYILHHWHLCNLYFRRFNSSTGLRPRSDPIDPPLPRDTSPWPAHPCSPPPSSAKPVPADLFAGVRYFINDDVDEATQHEVGICARTSMLSLPQSSSD